MRHGLYLPNFGSWGDPAEMVSLAVDAEAAGWDGFFIWDHLGMWENTMVDPWIALGAVAQATSTITIGTAVTPVPRRRPQKLARETVTLDRLSGGRFVFGVGSGPGGAEFDGMGDESSPRTRGAMLDEALDVIVELWSGEPVDHNGTHYRIEGAQFVPTPLQQPRIPIWVGGFWPNKKPIRRAARWDGVMPLFRASEDTSEVELLTACVDYVRSQRTSDAPFDVVQIGSTPGDDPTRAAEVVGSFEAAGATWWREPIAPFRNGEGFEEPWDTPRLRQRVLEGPPGA
ncbi:MAG: LLM class flavin-dependent oxidoreductase [Acidimicrobiia bacterium]|nr:LLM class flavin-dependent oxidoreductase [Acidimicrobiia bacterium]